MAERPRVLVTSWLVQEDDSALEVLRAAGCEVVMARTPRPRTAEQMIEALADVDGVIAGSDNYSAAVIGSTDRLKVIVRVGVGYDTVDTAAATARGIQVGTTPGTNHHAVADYAFGLVLALARNIVPHHVTTAAGQWTRLPGPDVWGKTIGILGAGAIGKGVGRRARGFDMTILAHDVAQDAEWAGRTEVAYVEVDELLGRSDFVTLHAPLLPSTRGLINAERLALMKPSSYLVNTARGELVDLDALAAALAAGRLAGAAIDVFPKEPPPADHPILRAPNVILSPHAAGLSIEANTAASRMACQSVAAALAGGRVAHCVNPEVFGG
ncbi:MAG TPA: phosphoglycerate dehydrogenase [Chloroflexota bacterium]